MRIAAAFFRGFVRHRLDAPRSPLFAHCRRRYRSLADTAEPAAVGPVEAKDTEEAAPG